MKIEIVVSLQGSSVIRTNDDGSSYLKLAADASQLPEVSRLALALNKPIRATLEWEG